ALALVHGARAVVEERGVLLADAAGVVRVTLDQAAAGLGDQLDGAVEGCRGQAAAAQAALDQDAGDAVIGQPLGCTVERIADVRRPVGTRAVGICLQEVSRPENRCRERRGDTSNRLCPVAWSA